VTFVKSPTHENGRNGLPIQNVHPGKLIFNVKKFAVLILLWAAIIWRQW